MTVNDAGMTDPAPLLWIADQVRNDGVAFTLWCQCHVLGHLTFDSSPIKGEGDMVGVVLFSAPHCGFWIKSRMTMRRIVAHSGVD